MDPSALRADSLSVGRWLVLVLALALVVVGGSDGLELVTTEVLDEIGKRLVELIMYLSSVGLWC